MNISLAEDEERLPTITDRVGTTSKGSRVDVSEENTLKSFHGQKINLRMQ
jgi:hypothetical protein